MGRTRTAFTSCVLPFTRNGSSGLLSKRVLDRSSVAVVASTSPSPAFAMTRAARFTASPLIDVGLEECDAMVGGRGLHTADAFVERVGDPTDAVAASQVIRAGEPDERDRHRSVLGFPWRGKHLLAQNHGRY